MVADEPPKPKQTDREARLAAALRGNLRRRKAAGGPLAPTAAPDRSEGEDGR